MVVELSRLDGEQLLRSWRRGRCYCKVREMAQALLRANRELEYWVNSTTRYL